MGTTEESTFHLSRLSALNNFFTDSRFGRFATVFSDKTIIEGKVDLTELSIVGTLDRIKDIVSVMTFSRIVFMIEESPKADRFLSVMKGYNLTQNGHPIRMDMYVMKKEGRDPGLDPSSTV